MMLSRINIFFVFKVLGLKHPNADQVVWYGLCLFISPSDLVSFIGINCYKKDNKKALQKFLDDILEYPSLQFLKIYVLSQYQRVICCHTWHTIYMT